MLLEAGIPLHSAVELIGCQQRKRRWARMLERVARSLREGEPLSKAVRPHRWAFGPGYAEALQWAEARGGLDDMVLVLRLLADDTAPRPPRATRSDDEDTNLDVFARAIGSERKRR
jgi:type II secretory pathway component PulF